MGKLFVVGVGPGSPEYLLPVARKTIDRAGVVAGAPRHLALAVEGQETFEITGSMNEALEEVRKLMEERDVALLVSGDPVFYSLFTRIKTTFEPYDYRIIPGVSSAQLACCRTGVLWDRAVSISVHGRSLERLREVLEDRGHGDQNGEFEAGSSDDEIPVVVLTDRRNTPSAVARYCLEFADPRRRVWVAKNLSYEDETVYQNTLEGLAESGEEGLCVMIIL